MFQKAIEKAHEGQKKALIEEATSSGATVAQVVEFGGDDSAAPAVVGGALKSLFGGKVDSDFAQVFQLTTGGLEHLYIQPYEGVMAVPGEHHARIPGALPRPVVFAKALFGGGKWKTGEDKDLAKRLAGHPPLKSMTKALKWTWAAGTTEIKLPWTVQIRPLQDGSSHIVMKAGRYGGFTTYKVGFWVFVQLCEQLKGVLAQGAQPVSEQDFIEGAQFGPVFTQFLPSGA